MSAFDRVKSNLLTGTALAVGVVAVPSLASAQSTLQQPYMANLGFVALTGAAPLTSFDISWVDTANQHTAADRPTNLNQYFLADKSNLAVDTFPIQPSPPVFFIRDPAHPFAGATASNNVAGPNGILTFVNPASAAPMQPQLWAGDGPTANPACPAAQPMCSTIKVFAGSAALPFATIATGSGKAPFQGVNRADELCYDGKDNIILIANDADPIPFDTFIDANNGNILGRTSMDGPTLTAAGLPAGNGQGATNGIEQCQWDPATNFFFQNIPEVGGPGDDSVAGAVIVFDPATMRPTPPANGLVPIRAGAFTVPLAQCAGPQGMALGPTSPNGGPQILLGCNVASPVSTAVPPAAGSGLQNSVVLNYGAGAVGAPTTQILVGQGGADEAWFEPVSKNYFLANGSQMPAQTLGIASSAGSGASLQNAFVGFSGSTARKSHSVAGWNGNVAGVPTSVALIPVQPVGGTPAPFSSTLCAQGTGLTQGCIGLFGSK